MITSVRVPWTGGVIHALHVAANTAVPRFVAVFVHGADRQFQNSEHWRPHLPALAGAFPDAEYYAVDLPGHGHSEPGASAPEPPSDADIVRSLATFLGQVYHKRPLVLFGRSKGGRQVFQAISQADPAVQEALSAFVLVAPAVNKPFMDLLSPRVRNTKSLLFWANDDPVIPYATHQALLDSMPVCYHLHLHLVHVLFLLMFCWLFCTECDFSFIWICFEKRRLCPLESSLC